MGKLLCSNLKFLLPNKGKKGKEEAADSLTCKYSNVNEEYKQAFRTKSYIEICNKIEDHLVRTTYPDEGQSPASSSSSSLSSSPFPIHNYHLSEHLLQPSLASISDHASNFHQLLANYLEISLEACRICETLLTNVHLVRNNHRRITKAMALINRPPGSASPTNDEYRVLYKNLASFASERSPYTTMNPQKFQELHEAHLRLFQELTSKCPKTHSRKENMKLTKRAVASFLVTGCCALVIVVLILAVHCVVGLAAAPGLAVWAFMKRAERRCNEKWLDGLVDIAARGVYVMINDFATVGRNVRRLEDEFERRRYLADVCVRKGKKEMVKKVVREFQMHESWFVEQLEELEKLIYLCFLDINRSRRLLVRELVRI